MTSDTTLVIRRLHTGSVFRLVAAGLGFGLWLYSKLRPLTLRALVDSSPASVNDSPSTHRTALKDDL